MDGRTMGFALRPLKDADIPQSVEVERDAFPDHLPPTSFRCELRNRMASYLVACRRDEVSKRRLAATADAGAYERRPDRGLVRALVRTAHTAWNGHGPGPDLIVGILGTWYMVDEAHVISVGVRSAYRGRGIGELLIIGAIEQAMARRAKMLTLEVRASNQVARNLYRKYGFSEVGLRKAYYADNREDGVIMATSRIDLPQFADRFHQLEREHRQRWGRARRALS